MLHHGFQYSLVRSILHNKPRLAFCSKPNIRLTLGISFLLVIWASWPHTLSAASLNGSSGGKAVLERRIFPPVYLPGPAFGVRVFSLKAVTPQVPDFLQQKIQETLAGNDPRLRLDNAAPDTVIECTITDIALFPGVANRTRSEYRRIGETMVTDPTTGTSRTQDVYGYVDVPYRVLVFEARMSVNCEVKDAPTGILIYSNRFDAVYAEDREVGGVGSSSVEDVNAIYLKLAHNAVGLILKQLSSRILRGMEFEACIDDTEPLFGRGNAIRNLSLQQSAGRI